jgi:hypothetical protein
MTDLRPPAHSAGGRRRVADRQGRTGPRSSSTAPCDKSTRADREERSGVHGPAWHRRTITPSSCARCGRCAASEPSTRWALFSGRRPPPGEADRTSAVGRCGCPHSSSSFSPACCPRRPCGCGSTGPRTPTGPPTTPLHGGRPCVATRAPDPRTRGSAACGPPAALGRTRSRRRRGPPPVDVLTGTPPEAPSRAPQPHHTHRAAQEFRRRPTPGNRRTLRDRPGGIRLP